MNTQSPPNNKWSWSRKIKASFSKMSLFKRILSLAGLGSLVLTISFGLFSIWSYLSGPTIDNQEEVINVLKTFQGKNNPNEIVILFKSSPHFNDSLEKSITSELNSFHKYLEKIGFELPKKCPPIGTTRGKDVIGVRANFYDEIALNENIWISEGSVNNPQEWVNAYAGFIFRYMFDPVGNIDPHMIDTKTARIYQIYFTFSYLLTPPPKGKKMNNWVNAIWDIREIYGQNVADQILYFASKNNFGTSSDFDTLFRGRIQTGIDVFSNGPKMDKRAYEIFNKYNLNRKN